MCRMFLRLHTINVKNSVETCKMPIVQVEMVYCQNQTRDHKRTLSYLSSL